jgi:hypothetical protein
MNNTGETIMVYAGLGVLFFTFTLVSIPAGNGQAVMAEKGKSVSDRGKNINREYGSISFFVGT